MARLALASSLLASVSLVGCGSVDSADPDPMDMGDTTPPTIASVTPTAGQAGVPADAAIVIVFSEPMDRASAEAAYTSQHLPKDAVTMTWNEAGDTLTITPKEPLALAQGIGNDPSMTDAKDYQLFVLETATDEAGNPLASAFELAFTTQKRMETSVGIVADLTRYRTSGGTTAPVGADLRIGDFGALYYRGFVTFDLAALPDGVEIEMAGFGVRQTAVIGEPFLLGAVDTAHVTYDTVNTTAWNAPALAMMDPLTTTAPLGPRTVDVTAAVADDVANRVARANRSQFRLQFSTNSDGDASQDTVELGTATFGMLIIYLAP